MSKNNKSKSPAISDENVVSENVKQTAVKPEKKDVKKADKNKNVKKSKKEKGSLKKKTKETFSELKKVTWPSFGEVCKKTGVVLVVVLIFAVVIFGMDYGLGALMQLLKG